MKTVVIKCAESVNNDNLRMMNELRFTATSKGTGAGKTTIHAIGSNDAEFKIISGNAYFVNGSGTNIGTTTNGDSATLIVSSGSAQISITNYDLVCDMLGYEDTNSGRLFIVSSDSNSPKIVLDLREITTKSFITSIVVKDFSENIKGDIGCLRGVTDLEKVELLKTGEDLYGSLTDLTTLPNLVYVGLGETNSDAYKNNIHWGFEDIIAMPNVTTFKLIGTILDETHGADLYRLFKGRTQLSLHASRSNNDVTITCSYVSGTSEIPTISVSNLSFYKSGHIDKNNLIAYMTMLKDGYNANKITCPESYFRALQRVINDSEVQALKSELSALGITINIEA